MRKKIQPKLNPAGPEQEQRAIPPEDRWLQPRTNHDVRAVSQQHRGLAQPCHKSGFIGKVDR